MVTKFEGIAVGFEQPPVPKPPKLENRNPEENFRQVERFLEEVVSFLELQQEVLKDLRRDVALRMNEMLVSGTSTEEPAADVDNRIFFNTTDNTAHFAVDGSFVQI